MKYLLLATLLSTSAMAGNAGDVIELHPYMNDAHCQYMKPCDITVNFDTSIKNNSTVGHYYKIKYKIWQGVRNWDEQIEEIHLEGGATYQHHYEMTVKRMYDRNTKNIVIFDHIVTGNDHKLIEGTGVVWMSN